MFHPSPLLGVNVKLKHLGCVLPLELAGFFLKVFSVKTKNKPLEKGRNITTVVSFYNFKNASLNDFHQKIWMRGYGKHKKVDFVKNAP